MPYLGKQPASVPVTADDIPNDSITTAKIVDAAITIADIGPNAVGSSEMADDAVGLNELSATGTTNTSTFLRGDNSWAVPPDTNTTYSVQDGELSQNNFTDADHTKLNGIAASANNYVHPNHSGEVTSTADGAQVIADNVVDEANLKVSNTPTNGYFLSAQSGNTGGLTWADIPAGVGGATGVDFNDNVKARFGTGNDLEMFHDGSHSYIKDLGTGNLKLMSDGAAVSIEETDGTNMILCRTGGSMDLYHNGTKKFETSSAGATVSGALTATAGSGAIVKVEEGGGSLMFMEAGGNGSHLKFKAGHYLNIKQDDNNNYLILNNNHTIDHFGTAGNWMKMLFAGSTNNEYFISFRMSNNSQVGTIQTNGSTVSYNTSSDYRLKENVDYNWDATTRLKQLKPARFNWIADETNTVVDGFIAHEVEGIVPEAISGAKDAMEAAVLYQEGDELPEGKEVGDVKVPEQISPQSIDQSKLVPLLVKAMQEQQTTIEALTARITALEG